MQVIYAAFAIAPYSFNPCTPPPKKKLKDIKNNIKSYVLGKTPLY
jgi:hypothetical protein